MASRTLIAYGNRCDEGTLSGGTWLSTLPLANLQNRLIAKVARSSGTTTAATQFDINLGRARRIGMLSLIGHNLTVVQRCACVATTPATLPPRCTTAAG